MLKARKRGRGKNLGLKSVKRSNSFKKIKKSADCFVFTPEKSHHILPPSSKIRGWEKQPILEKEVGEFMIKYLHSNTANPVTNQ